METISNPPTRKQMLDFLLADSVKRCRVTRGFCKYMTDMRGGHCLRASFNKAPTSVHHIVVCPLTLEKLQDQEDQGGE